jgi:hypothetical protein|tara:strand:- start:728 stop:1540 length:813 start_codon:yes stop_codon:yes gene_type:complete
MIENSIEQFRAKRNANSKRVDTVSNTKQRLGLAQREIARSENQTSRLLQQSAETQEAAYNPEEKISKWADELEALRAERSTTNALSEVPASTGSSGSMRPATRFDASQSRPGGAGGRSGAEGFLGRTLSDTEWDQLLRTTYAESSMGSNEERAAVMSVVLNRVKNGNYGGDTVTAVIQAKNQFQAVTGTADNPGPSDNYKTFNNNGEDLATFGDSVVPLLSNFTEQNWLNFTAANPDAYGKGTNIDFMEQVARAQGSMQIGLSIFGTVEN